MKKQPKMRSFASRLTGWIMLMMLITMGLVSYLTYDMATSFIFEEEFLAHESYVDSKVGEVGRAISDVYVGTVNHVPEIERNLGQPDRLSDIMHEIVVQNPGIRSCGLSFVENYYPQKGRGFCPFAIRRDSSQVDVANNTDPGYLSAKWFAGALKTKEGYWSKAFFEGNDSTTPLVAYLHPIHDAQGRTVAVLGADLSLEGLRQELEESDAKIMEKEWVEDKDSRLYSFLIEADGTYLAHPDSSRVLRDNLFDHTKADPDSLSTIVAQKMTSGKKGYLGKMAAGQENLIEGNPDYDPSDGLHFDGQWSYVFYAPIERTNWSLGLTVPAHNIRLVAGVVGGMLLALIAIGLLVVYLVCRFAIRRITKPLKQLAASADEVAKGNFNTILPTIKHNDEIGLLRNSFEGMQQSLAKYIDELKSTTASKAAIENELMVAHNIQMGMLPKVFPPYPERDDIDIFGMLSPAKEVGGDLFDFYLRDGQLFFCIGDVSGKGVPASLLMAVTRSLFRNISVQSPEPAHIVAALNKALAEGNESCMFVTLFAGVIDLSSGRMRYCNAGHDAPLLIGQSVGQLPCEANVPLGVMPDWPFIAQETVVSPQTTILLYTDGLTEAENIQFAQFGIHRVEQTAQALLAAGTHTPHAFVRGMEEAVRSFVGEASQSDDLTMLAIKYTKHQ